MGYLDLGVVLAIISVPIVMYYSLAIDTIFNEELIKWWNGERYYSNFIPLEVLGMTLICTTTFLLTAIIYPLIIGGAIIAMIVISLRNKRLARINKQK